MGDSPRKLRPARAELAFAFCLALFTVVLVLTNVIGTKLFEVFRDGGPAALFDGGPWTLTSGILTYPLTFLLTDLVSEIWGRKKASFMVLAGFAMSLLMLVILQLAIALPPSPHWSQAERGFPDGAAMQTAFEATFANPGVLLAASMLAYLVAQLCDVHLYHFWWKITGGRHMWLRNNGSTLVSQLVDTIIVNAVFLHFGKGFGPANGWTWERIGDVIVAVYLCKVVLALVDTPLIYLARGWMERFLGIEHDPSRGRAPLA
jgi:queuosine precursor transporter